MDIIDVGSKKVDITAALPLLLRDWIALDDVGVTMETMQHASIKTMHALAQHVIKKADPQFPVDEILNMTLAQLREVFKLVGQAEVGAVVNRPSSTSSTSSP